ncbi:MAG: phosphate signaling complex protein PhoU [Burkholderiaceae bacterium]|jgi:phosphate transport system protein|nr:MAG: phosphate signaling complex protein PhoU [Burkholderiaceae bacterium]
MTDTTQEHIVKSFDTELQRLTGEIVAMGESATRQLEAALQALEQRDSAAAERIAADDDSIDERERRISHDVLRLLALRQPFARDLRAVLAALRIASDIERIGDYAANIAKRSITLNRVAPIPLVGGLAPLARMAARLVRDALKAYSTQDAELARAVWGRDADLDILYVTLFRELLTYMMEDARSITAGAHLLFIAKDIERIGDHATNVAENVWFVVRGEPLSEPRAKMHTTDPL